MRPTLHTECQGLTLLDLGSREGEQELQGSAPSQQRVQSTQHRELALGAGGRASSTGIILLITFQHPHPNISAQRDAAPKLHQFFFFPGGLKILKLRLLHFKPKLSPVGSFSPHHSPCSGGDPVITPS